MCCHWCPGRTCLRTPTYAELSHGTCVDPRAHNSAACNSSTECVWKCKGRMQPQPWSAQRSSGIARPRITELHENASGKTPRRLGTPLYQSDSVRRAAIISSRQLPVVSCGAIDGRQMRRLEAGELDAENCSQVLI